MVWQVLAIVTDENVKELIHNAIDESDLRVAFVADPQEASRRLDAERFHLLVVDDDDVGDQTDILQNLDTSDMPLVLIVRAKTAADRYGEEAAHWTLVRKPIQPDTLRNTLQALKDSIHLPQAMDYLRHTQPYIYKFDNIVAASEKMRDILALVSKVAATHSSVLIQGETGTGKELIAAAVHFNSPRHNQNFVAVNCAALHENLLESELFGHEKGAFTGAYKRRIGRFEQANGGTLFLDEIGDMSLVTQAKVLRILQEQKFERLGGTQTITVNVRVIAATNRPLQQMIEAHTFREDLYFRLNVIPIRIPPLRERTEDILPLAIFFLNRFRQEAGRPDLAFSPQTLDRLKSYHWPGNIRELENVIERAVLISNGRIIRPEDLILQHFSPSGKQTKSDTLPDLNLAKLERWAIEQAMTKTHGVQKEAARLLGISPRAIHYKIRKYKIDLTQFDGEGIG